MYQSANVVFNPLISFDSADLTGAYVNFGSFTYAARIIHIVNDSNEDVLFSFDGGVTDHLFVKAGTFLLYDFGTNRGNSAPGLEIAPTAIMINGSAGMGDIYCMSIAAISPTNVYPGV